MEAFAISFCSFLDPLIDYLYFYLEVISYSYNLLYKYLSACCMPGTFCVLGIAPWAEQTHPPGACIQIHVNWVLIRSAIREQGWNDQLKWNLSSARSLFLKTTVVGKIEVWLLAAKSSTVEQYSGELHTSPHSPLNPTPQKYCISI